MTKPRTISSKALLPPAQAPSDQMSIAFKSIWLRGMSAPERMGALMHLANILMLAAGVATKECDDER